MAYDLMSMGGIDLGNVVVYLQINSNQFDTDIRLAGEKVQDMGTSLQNKLNAVSNSLTHVGTAMSVGITAPIVALGKSALDSGKSFESAFTGVKKTLDVTEDAVGNVVGTGMKVDALYNQLSENIKQMSTETASSRDEIARVMEIAGQLGVKIGRAGEDITEFTRTMVMLGDTTDLAADEAAESLAKFMNITNTAESDVRNLGSSIVALGNNFATNESDITLMATRLASAGTIAGLTEREILALSTAISSVGIRAEAGGTAMSTTLTQIGMAVDKYLTGDKGAIEKVQQLASVADMSATEFVTAWKDKPVTAIEAFIRGLGNADEAGESMSILLDDLGMKSIRQSNLLRALALSADNMGEAIELSNKAWEENTALADEASLRYGTFESKVQQFKNEWANFTDEIYVRLIPVLEKLMDVVRDLLDKWDNLTEGQKNFALGVAAVVAALGPLLVIAGKLLTIAKDFAVLKSVLTGASAIGTTVAEASTAIEGATVAAGAGKVALAGLGTACMEVVTNAAVLVGGFKVFDTFIKNPFINTLGKLDEKLTGNTETVKTMIHRYGQFNDTFRIVKDSANLFSNALQGLPAIMDGADVSSRALEKALNKVSNGFIYTDKQLDKIHDKWKLSEEDMETLRQAMIDAHPEITKITDNFTQLNTASVETLYQVANGFKEMEERGRTVDDILNGNAKTVRNLNDEARAFFTQMKDSTVTVQSAVGEMEEKIVTSSGRLNLIGRDIINGIYESANAEMPKVVNGVENWSNQVNEKLKSESDKTYEQGKYTIQQFNKGATDESTKSSKLTAENINKSFTEALSKNEGTNEAGKNLVAGFSNGIDRNIKMANGSVVKMCDSALFAMHKALDEHSPSGISEKSGYNLVKGFDNGVTNNTKIAVSSVSDWISDVLKVFSQLDKGTYFYQIGTNIINSLLNGMQQAWGGMTKWLGNSVGSFGSAFGSINGYHQSGLDYVPYDGYVAALHQGERVLTKEESQQYNQGNNSGGDTYIFNNVKDDPYEYARQIRNLKKELAF